MEFVDTDPTLSNYWRSVILFGQNTTSYKFALAKSLLDLKESESDLIMLDDLAPRFANHICQHLKTSNKQGTSKSNSFLNACQSFNTGLINETELIHETRRSGFKYVFDAFHVVNRKDIPKRFFIDERRTSKGLRLTDHFYNLFEENNSSNLLEETEGRWRLVETAWNIGISSNLILFDDDNERLYTSKENERIDVTSCRSALNGYQKGRCFYSFKPISIEPLSENLAEIDHFFPHTLKSEGVIRNLDGVWNLVLSSQECNRGKGGKHALAPSLRLLERLHKRNEYLIDSHHPLRETLINQTGTSESLRRSFLQNCYNHAKQTLIHTWEPLAEDTDSF